MRRVSKQEWENEHMHNPMTEGEALAVRFDPDPIQNDDSRIWTYMIDIGKHGAAVECHGETRELALARAQAVFAALTAHTAASGGEVVGEVTVRDGWDADKASNRLVTFYGDLPPVGTKLYTAPPAAVPGDALERLVEKWRADKVDDAHSTSQWDQGYAYGRSESADELAALIPKGADHGQR